MPAKFMTDFTLAASQRGVSGIMMNPISWRVAGMTARPSIHLQHHHRHHCTIITTPRPPPAVLRPAQQPAEERRHQLPARDGHVVHREQQPALQHITWSRGHLLNFQILRDSDIVNIVKFR